MPYSVVQVMSCTLGSPGNATAKRSVRFVYVVHSCEKEGHETSSINAAALSQIRRMIILRSLLRCPNTARKTDLAHQIPGLRNLPAEPRCCRPNQRPFPLCLSRIRADSRWSRPGGDGIGL